VSSWVCLYPIYFDAERSSRNGRKVPKELAYPKPDIRAIREAVRRLRLSTAIEVSDQTRNDTGQWMLIQMDG
jgi:signal recognition particle subunit SRP19